jgi:hypothetical protein
MSLPTQYHKLAKMMLEEGVINHDQAFTLTKLMIQIDYRERTWELDRSVTDPSGRFDRLAHRS